MLLHEIGEHYGLEGMLGDNYLPTLIQLNKLKDTDSVVAAAWAQVTRNYTGSDPVRYKPGSVNFLREVAAHIGETAPQKRHGAAAVGPNPADIRKPMGGPTEQQAGNGARRVRGKFNRCGR